MKRVKLIIYLVAVLILALIVKNAGTFIVINQPPQKAGVIIILTGGADDRAKRGIQLYQQGYAPYLLFTGASILPKRLAMSEGVPEQSIILDYLAQNTYQNAVNSKALMEQYGFRSAVVVSTYVSVKTPGFNPSKWWTSRQTMLRMAYEYGGIAALYLGLGPYITGAWVWNSPFWSLFKYMN